MSHLRNLFHKPSDTGNALPVASLKTIREIADAEVGVATASLSLSDFPVEEAVLGADNRIVVHTDPRSPAADRFRLLRMRLKEHWTAGKVKKLLVTGPLAQDGKSTVLLNLATALSERGKRSVLVVEADLHHSSLAGMLKLKPWIGLAECLVNQEETSPLSAIRRIEPLGWYLLPAGEPRRNPSELLQTPAFGNIMQSLSGCFDWILVDSPPVIPLTDSISMRQHVDASLLVVRAGETPREAVDQTIALLGKKNIVGIILNGVEARDHLYYQYYERNRRYQEE